MGLGPSWGARHQPALRALATRFELRAICDPVAHLARQVAAETGARAVDGFRSVAAAEDVDAVLILSARWFGALPILAACDYGKAVYCGASVDIEACEAEQIRQRVSNSGIAFMAEFPNRLAPATIRLQELMATQLGRPRLLFCNQRHTSQDNHNGRNRAGGQQGPRDANMRHLVEMIDWCRYLVGRDVTAVTGMSHAATPQEQTHSQPQTNGKHVANPSCDDYSLMVLEFAENGTPGPVAQIACGSYVPPGFKEAAAFRRPADLQVICERGIAFVDLPSTLVWFDDAGQHTESLEHERPVGEQLLMHFHRSVSSLVLKTSGLEDAYRATSLVIAARESHQQGCRIEVDLGSE